MQFSGQTMSVQGGSAFSGVGFARVSGGTFTVDTASFGAVTFTNLDVTGGQMLHEGEVQVLQTMLWSGGELESNGVGEPGITRITGSASLTTSGVLSKGLLSHRLVVDAGAGVTLGGSGNLQTGSSARIENEGTVAMTGTGGILYNLGGGNSIFVNGVSGTLTTVGATVGQVTTLMDNVGTLAVVGDTLRLNGGGFGNLSGNAIVNNAALKFGGGSFAMTGPLAVTGTAGDLAVAAGVLDVGPNALTVGGDLRVTGTGQLVSQNAAAMVSVQGDVVFNSTAGSSLTDGELEVGGNFVQAGAATAFAASGNHLTRFIGVARQTVSFGNPGLINSRFAAVSLGEATNPRRLDLLTNVFMASLSDTTGISQDSIISGNNSLLTVANANVTEIVFAGARLAVTNAAGGHTLSAIRFDLMDVTATQLTVDLNQNVVQGVFNASFATTPTTGFYVVARQMSTGTPATLSFPAPVTPTNPAPFYDRVVGSGSTQPNISWAGVTNPLPP